MLFYILVSFMAAMVSVFYIRRYFRKHAQSYAEDAPQRFHHGAIPRLGGAGIFLGLLLGLVVALVLDGMEASGKPKREAVWQPAEH